MSNELVSYKNAKKAMENISSRKIDIKASIENAKKADFLGFEDEYCMAINFLDVMPAYFSELLDPKDLSPVEYYENVFRYLEMDNGIYIALTYLSDVSPSEDSLEFNDNSSLEDNYFILEDKYFEELIDEYYDLGIDKYEYFRIDNAFNPITVKCPLKYGLFCDIASDYGINIKKEGDEFKVRFGHRQFSSAGPCMGPQEFLEFTESGDPSDENSLDNPLNQLMILLMEKIIVFED